MKAGTTRAVLCIALLALVPLVSAVHLGHLSAAPGSGASANDHGPWVPCPEANEAPCVACASATFFAPVAAAARLCSTAEPTGELRDACATFSARSASAVPIGRSPPVL